MASTALGVLVPEAESVISEVRARHDPSAQLGVPAHVILLFPFMPPERYRQPSAPFIALARGIAAAFPEHLPYEGRHADIVPHLSVGEGSAAAAEQASEEISAVLAKGVLLAYRLAGATRHRVFGVNPR